MTAVSSLLMPLITCAAAWIIAVWALNQSDTITRVLGGLAARDTALPPPGAAPVRAPESPSPSPRTST